MRLFAINLCTAILSSLCTKGLGSGRSTKETKNTQKKRKNVLRNMRVKRVHSKLDFIKII